MSLRRLYGWEPRQITEYVYEAGVLVKSVTYPEPEFTGADVDRMIAFDITEREIGTHGIPMAEATNPVNEYAYEGLEKPIVDFAERALKQSQERYYKRWPDADRAGHIWTVKRAPLVAAEQEPDLPNNG